MMCIRNTPPQLAKTAGLIEHFYMRRNIEERRLLALSMYFCEHRADRFQQRLSRQLIIYEDAVFPRPRKFTANDKRGRALIKFNAGLAQGGLHGLCFFQIEKSFYAPRLFAFFYQFGRNSIAGDGSK